MKYLVYVKHDFSIKECANIKEWISFSLLLIDF